MRIFTTTLLVPLQLKTRSQKLRHSREPPSCEHQAADRRRSREALAPPGADMEARIRKAFDSATKIISCPIPVNLEQTQLQLQLPYWYLRS